MDLLDNFGIANIAIRDRDDDSSLPTHPNLFKTTKRDFEEEIVSLILDSKKEILKKIIIDYEDKPDNKIILQKGTLDDAIKRYNLNNSNVPINLRLSELDNKNDDEKKLFYLAWFSNKNKKSIMLGKTIGDLLTEELIPQVYKDLIYTAEKLSKNA